MGTLLSRFNDNSENISDCQTGLGAIDRAELGAELLFIQDINGQYLAFYWKFAEEYGITEQALLGRSPEAGFGPIDVDAYTESCQRVIQNRTPETYRGLFTYQNQSFPLALVLSPILSGQEAVTRLLVMGYRCDPDGLPFAPALPLPSVELEQSHLAQISRKIRRTLHLPTIWHETVNGIGEALQVSRCLMLTKDPSLMTFQVQAEFCQPQVISLRSQQITDLLENYDLSVLERCQPLLMDYEEPDRWQTYSMLMMPTFYQQQCNGLICIQQCDRPRYWSPQVIESLQELAEQVGTAIAHATLYHELEQATRTAQEASQLKSEFLANTTHELRTPLNGIIGFLKLVLDGMTDSEEEAQEFLEEAYQSALHLLNLINDILDLAKIESGKIDLELSTVDLAEVCQAVSNFATPQAQAKNLDFEINLPKTLTPITIYGNYRWLLQIVLNLVGNAIKFTHQGQVSVKAEVIKQKIDWKDQIFPGKVKISVTDTGIGVALDQQARLFEKFVQIDGSRTKAYGGTGLGLSISQKLVEAMGGTIAFFSMGEGLGSTVTFSALLDHLPVLKTDGIETKLST
ncbi:MAG: ATP-binding protein [Snowella sp.]|nr:ATP-binding protein [Snowella sp.]